MSKGLAERTADEKRKKKKQNRSALQLAMDNIQGQRTKTQDKRLKRSK